MVWNLGEEGRGPRVSYLKLWKGGGPVMCYVPRLSEILSVFCKPLLFLTRVGRELRPSENSRGHWNNPNGTSGERSDSGSWLLISDRIQVDSVQGGGRLHPVTLWVVVVVGLRVLLLVFLFPSVETRSYGFLSSSAVHLRDTQIFGRDSSTSVLQDLERPTWTKTKVWVQKRGVNQERTFILNWNWTFGVELKPSLRLNL